MHRLAVALHYLMMSIILGYRVRPDGHIFVHCARRLLASFRGSQLVQRVLPSEALEQRARPLAQPVRARPRKRKVKEQATIRRRRVRPARVVEGGVHHDAIARGEQRPA